MIGSLSPDTYTTDPTPAMRVHRQTVRGKGEPNLGGGAEVVEWSDENSLEWKEESHIQYNLITKTIVHLPLTMLGKGLKETRD